MKFIDLTGKKFGKLEVLSIAGRKNGRIYWTCQCDCGKQKMVLGQSLTSGRVVSCGCSSIERISLLNKTHSESKKRLYSIWAGIKNRCYNKNNVSYKNYGGRGIIMCDNWENDYISFRDWSLENGYDDTLTIERIDVNGNYEPSNCKWATRKEQGNNTRRTIKLQYGGKEYSALQLSEALKINYKRFIYGLKKFEYNVPKAIEYAKLYKRRKNYEL